MIPVSTLHLVAALIGALAVMVLALAVFLPQAAAARHRFESGTEDEPKLSSLSARVPVSEIRNGLIVRRDGSFCAGWECSGVATQKEPSDLNRRRAKIVVAQCASSGLGNSQWLDRTEGRLFLCGMGVLRCCHAERAV